MRDPANDAGRQTGLREAVRGAAERRGHGPGRRRLRSTRRLGAQLTNEGDGLLDGEVLGCTVSPAKKPSLANAAHRLADRAVDENALGRGA